MKDEQKSAPHKYSQAGMILTLSVLIIFPL